MTVDPAAAMRCWAVDVEIGGRVFHVPALPAADWWPVVAANDTSLVLDLVTDSTGLDDLLLSGRLGDGELVTALTDAVEETAGRSLYRAHVVAAMAEATWAVTGGHLALQGFRWDRAPLAAALDAAHVLLLTHLPEKLAVEGKERNIRQEYLTMLDTEFDENGRPKPGEQITAEFESMAGPKPKTGVRATAGQSGSARPRTRLRRPPPHQDVPSGAPRKRPGPRAGSGPVASS